jgi:hypothetical protein
MDALTEESSYVPVDIHIFWPTNTVEVVKILDIESIVIFWRELWKEVFRQLADTKKESYKRKSLGTRSIPSTGALT